MRETEVNHFNEHKVKLCHSSILQGELKTFFHASIRANETLALPQVDPEVACDVGWINLGYFIVVQVHEGNTDFVEQEEGIQAESVGTHLVQFARHCVLCQGVS